MNKIHKMRISVDGTAVKMLASKFPVIMKIMMKHFLWFVCLFAYFASFS